MARWYDPWGIASDTYHTVTGQPTAKEKRAQQNLIGEQIKAYKDQTEITRNEINAKKDEQASQKRRIEEKQIRSLRNNYRPQGFLGNQNPNTVDPGMTAKLGG